MSARFDRRDTPDRERPPADTREQRGVNFTAGALRQVLRRLARLEAEVRELRRNNADRHQQVVAREEMQHGTFAKS